eukprot:scaffold75563_cov30-Tisochrysis_lutea.AAC.1
MVARKTGSAMSEDRSGSWCKSACLAALGAVTCGVFLVPFCQSSPQDGPPVQASSMAATSVESSFGLLSPDLLSNFTAEHNSSLLWGTYRPGVYFGLRSRTIPTALVAGLMWTSARPDGTAEQSTLRHQCEQDSIQKYGFSQHDGRGYGHQLILDPENGIALNTSFLRAPFLHSGGSGSKFATGGWAVRITGKPTMQRAKDQHVYFYVAIDSEFADHDMMTGSLHIVPAANSHPAQEFLVTGTAASLGDFSILMEARETLEESSGAGAASLPIHVWGSAIRKHSHLNVDEIVMEQTSGTRHANAGVDKDHQNLGRLNGIVDEGSHLLVLQVRSGDRPFEIDITYLPAKGNDDLEGQGTEICSDLSKEHCKKSIIAQHRQWHGVPLGEEIVQRADAFRSRLINTFGLKCRVDKADDELAKARCQSPLLNGRPLGSKEIDFAAAALGAQLGSLGFFYGQTILAQSDADKAPERTALAPLLSIVPSRPFFPRGFLWDEGFHVLLVGAWDEDLAGEAVV